MKPTMPCEGWKNIPKRKRRGMKGFRKVKVKKSSRKIKRFRHMGRGK